MHSGIAAAFRSVRQGHGVSLADAASALGVDASYLRAIEDGTIQDITSDVVAKAHLRVYARYLGYDSEAVLRGDPPGTPSVDAPVTSHKAEGRDSDGLGSARRRDIAPAARVVAAAPEAIASPGERMDESARDDARTPVTPAPLVEVVEEPERPEDELGDDRARRRRVAVLAILGSMIVGLLVALLIGGRDTAASGPPTRSTPAAGAWVSTS